MISQLIMAAALSVGPNIGDVRLRGPARLKHLDCPKVPMPHRRHMVSGEP